MRYRIAGLVLESTVPLPSLVPAGTGDTVDLTFHLSRGPVPPRDGAVGETEECEWFAITTHARGWTLSFRDMATFDVSSDGRAIVGRAAPDLPLGTIHHLLLDHALPRALSLRGELILHATAVILGGGAVAFCGESGAGKSTIAAALVRRGAALLGDDFVRLEPWAKGKTLVHPGPPRLRLWEDSAESAWTRGTPREPVAHYADKAVLDVPASGGALALEAAPLVRVYHLEPAAADGDATIGARPLRRSEASIVLAQNLFRIDAESPERARTEFQALMESGATSLLSALLYPRDHGRLTEVAAFVEADVAEVS